MAMSPFEKALLGELKGIRKELHDLNRNGLLSKEVQVDGEAIAKAVNQPVTVPLLKSAFKDKI